MPRFPTLARAFLIALLGSAAHAALGQVGAQQVIRQGFDIAVPYTPTIARIGLEDLLRYELHLTNFSSRTLTLKSVHVVDAGSGRTLGKLDGDALVPLLDAPGKPSATGDPRDVEPGRRLVVYLDVPLTGRTVKRVRHKLDFTANGPEGETTASVVGGELDLNGQPVQVLGPPLRGGPWTAVYHPTLERGHRRVVYAVAGRAVIPGRFAIDWMPAGPQPDLESGSGQGSGSSIDVLAVSNGVVVGVRDEFPEPPPGIVRAPVPLSKATGNYVALRLRSGLYAFYEHLLPGVPVRLGDRVVEGQVVGRMGSTGSASRAHLHFHLADASSPLDAEGVPYALTRTQQVGAYMSVDAAEASGSWQPQAPNDLNSFPPPNAVVTFPR